MQIWDTVGQERFRTLIKAYYKGSNGIILTYDVTDENSFKNIRTWVKQIEQNAQSSVCKVLVGNKCDRDDRKVTLEEGQKLSKEFNMQFFETSAKTNYNVNETFTYLTREILNSTEGNDRGKVIGELKKDDKDKNKSVKDSKCCK